MSEFFEIYENTWAMEDGGVRLFLLIGNEKALVIDTGMNCPDVLGEARKITELPLLLINSHADRDHISSNGQFESVLMHPSEGIVYRNINGRTEKTEPVYDGDRIDLGGRTVEVIHVPGHTPGSITVLDPAQRCLLGGDPIQEDGRIFMFGVHRDMPAYVAGLQHVWEREAEFDRIYPSHAKLCVEKEIIPKLIAAAQDVIDGKVEGVKSELHGNEIMVYNVGFDCFLGPVK